MLHLASQRVRGLWIPSLAIPIEIKRLAAQLKQEVDMASGQRRVESWLATPLRNPSAKLLAQTDVAESRLFEAVR
jgi:hypothetical protein